MAVRIGISLFIISLSLVPLAHSGDKAASVSIGVIDTLFDGKDKVLAAQVQTFAELIKSQTGVNGEFSVVRGVEAMGKELAAGRLSLGVVHGVEYGWLKRICPDCKPLVAAVNETPLLKAYVLAAKTNKAQTSADLRGQSLALPTKTLLHTRIFLERLVNAPPGQFYKTLETTNTDAAMDAVVDGQAQLTAVGNAALDAYRDRKPGRFNRLRILAESPDFPPGVIVYRPANGVKPELIAEFRDKLLKANQTAEGRQTLTLWRLRLFEEVPADYEKVVEAIVKAYPPESKQYPLNPLQQ